jgi:hypothetical protein
LSFAVVRVPAWFLVDPIDFARRSFADRRLGFFDFLGQ